MRHLYFLVFIVLLASPLANATTPNQGNQTTRLTMVNSTTPSQNAEIIQGNWQILNTQTIQNREILVNGNMFISAPKVVIQNTTLYVVGTLYIQASNLIINKSAITVQYNYTGAACTCTGNGIVLDSAADNMQANSSSFFSNTRLFDITEGADNLFFQNNSFSNLFDTTIQILSSNNVTFNLNRFELVDSHLPTLSLFSGYNFAFTYNTGNLFLVLNGTNSKDGVIDKVTITYNSLQGGMSVTSIKNSIINSNSILALNHVAFNSGGHMIFVDVQNNQFSSKSDELSFYYTPADGDNMTLSFNTVDGSAQLSATFCNNPVEWRYDVPRYDLDFVNNNFKEGLLNGPQISLDSSTYQTPDTIHLQTSCVTSAMYSINGSIFQNIETNFISLNTLKTGNYLLKIITNTDGLFLDFSFSFSYANISVIPNNTSSSTQETHSKILKISAEPNLIPVFITLYVYRRKLKHYVITHSTMK